MLVEGRCSDPNAWPAPFCAESAVKPTLVDLGDRHFVRSCAPL
jgi:peptide/nickel transport system ATP-binding protein